MGSNPIHINAASRITKMVNGVCGKSWTGEKIQGTFSIFCIRTNAGMLKNAAHEVDNHQIVWMK
jgi:hypothetical protein